MSQTALRPVAWMDHISVCRASVAISNPVRQAMEAMDAITAARAAEGLSAPRGVVREHVTNHGTVVYREAWGDDLL